MAAGDIFAGGPADVSVGGFFEIRPPVGVQATIVNIYYSGPVEFYFSDGTTDLKFDSDVSAGARLCMAYNVSNARFLKVKNIGSSIIKVAYDGIEI